MKFLARRKLRIMLEECDYQLASDIIREKFGNQEEPFESSSCVRDYVSNPCFKTAAQLVETDPLFTYYFIESKPGGLYARKKQSEERAATALQPETDQARSRQGRVVRKEPDSRQIPTDLKPDSNQANLEVAAACSVAYNGEFTNVISTLRLDIEQLQDQVGIFEASMRGYPQDHAELKKYEQLAAAYRKGIAEFQEAVRILQSFSKSNRR